MGDASRAIPGILQRDSLSRQLPIENSPPGIQTIPGVAVPGARNVFDTVGPKLIAAKAVTDSSGGAGALAAAGASPRDHEAFIAWTVNAAAATRPTVINQPNRELFFEAIFRFISFSLFFESENPIPVVLHADHNP